MQHRDMMFIKVYRLRKISSRNVITGCTTLVSYKELIVNKGHAEIRRSFIVNIVQDVYQHLVYL